MTVKCKCKIIIINYNIKTYINRLETSQQSILQDVVLPMNVTYCIHEQ